VAQVEEHLLESMSPWVQPPVPPKKRTNNKNQTQYWSEGYSSKLLQADTTYLFQQCCHCSVHFFFRNNFISCLKKILSLYNWFGLKMIFSKLSWFCHI
jgi:hypothetical protein